MHEEATGGIDLCASERLEDGGEAHVFELLEWQRPVRAFVLRFEGRLHGYLNRCAHVPMELDWVEGQFFESSGLYLMCATHGAIYQPDTGKCVGGPCRGARLRAVRVEERDTPEGRAVFWLPDDALHPAQP